MQAEKNAGLSREAALLEGKCQLKAALSSALESKSEVEGALQSALLDQQRLQQEVCCSISLVLPLNASAHFVPAQSDISTSAVSRCA